MQPPPDILQEFTLIAQDYTGTLPPVTPGSSIPREQQVDRLATLAKEYPELLAAPIGTSPSFVHHCRKKNNLYLLTMLQEKGVTVPFELRDAEGYTVLLRAVSDMRNCSGNIIPLLKSGADATATLPYGDNVFHLIDKLSNESYICKWLAEYGADIDARNAGGRKPLDIHFAIDEGTGARGVGIPSLIAAGADAFTWGSRPPADTPPEDVAAAAIRVLSIDGPGGILMGMHLRHSFDPALRHFKALTAPGVKLNAESFVRPGGVELTPTASSVFHYDLYPLISLGLFSQIFKPERFHSTGEMISIMNALPPAARKAAKIIENERELPLARPGSAVERYLRGDHDTREAGR